MKVNKICFLSSMHGPHDKRVFHKEAVSLASAGFSVSHLCVGSVEEASMEKGVLIKKYHGPSGILGRLGHLRRLYRLAKSEDADVYHCNEVDSWAVGVALRLIRGKRCVFDVHEHYPSTFAESRFPRWLRPIIAAAVRLAFRLLTPFTDRIVLAKRSVAEDFCIDEHKKVFVLNYTPLAGLNLAEQCPKPVAHEVITLVHSGLFGKLRGWPQILDAVAAMQHQNVRLEVIGSISDGSRGEFERRVSELELSERVRFYEWLPFDEAFAHLLRAHIGLIAFQPGILNHLYAMPHKLFDYMAAGLAVVLPNFSVEIVPIVQGSGCGVLVNPADPLDIATKLDELIDSPRTMREMGARGQQAVRRRYNWEAEAEKLIAMYNSMQVS